MIRKAKDVEWERRVNELKWKIQDALRTETSWNIIIETLCEVLDNEIRAFNKYTVRKRKDPFPQTKVRKQ